MNQMTCRRRAAFHRANPFQTPVQITIRTRAHTGNDAELKGFNTAEGSTIPRIANRNI